MGSHKVPRRRTHLVLFRHRRPASVSGCGCCLAAVAAAPLAMIAIAVAGGTLLGPPPHARNVYAPASVEQPYVYIPPCGESGLCNLAVASPVAVPVTPDVSEADAGPDEAVMLGPRSATTGLDANGFDANGVCQLTEGCD